MLHCRRPRTPTFSVGIARYKNWHHVSVSVDGEDLSRRRVISRIADSVHRLDLKSGLQTEVLREIVEGPRTVRELVQIIFGEDRDNPSFETHYARTRRALKQLEARGYVSAALFGREKPYRLTKHGERCLASLAIGLPTPSVALPTDLGLFGATLFLGILNLVGQALGGPATSIVPSAFLLLLGLSLCRAFTILREVR